MYWGGGPIGRRLRVGAVAMVLALIGPAGLVVEQSAAAGTSTALTRYPYLTDSIQSSITVNWATDTSDSSASVTWGPPGSCAANAKAASRTSITVISRAEYQWEATIPVAPDTTYCYRVLLGGTDLLGSDPSPTFTSQVAAGSTAPFSFDVFGDWGQAYANGNLDQTNVLRQMAASGARFAVMTGDTAYPSGGQAEYGDLQQAGVDRSTVFGPTFWTVPGRSLPVFNVTGNHGFTNGAVQVINWPETNAAAASGGTYAMQPYPSINGTAASAAPMSTACRSPPLGSLHSQIQPQEHAVQVRHVADQPLQRPRETLDERGHGHDLLVPCQAGLVVNVDHLQMIPPVQVLLAHALNIFDRHP